MKYRAILAAMACLLVACDQPMPTEPTPVPEPSFQFDATSVLESVVLGDHPLAAQLPTTPLSESGADIAVGGGQSNLGTENFDLSAHTGPQGDFGHWGVKVHNLAGELIVRYSVDVFCVHIHGVNRGLIKGVVKKVEPTTNALGVTEGEITTLVIRDGGSPSDAPVDDFVDTRTDVFPGVSCKNLFSGGDFNNVNQGQVLIRMNGSSPT